jgi:hypothetical protein
MTQKAAFRNAKGGLLKSARYRAVSPAVNTYTQPATL